MIHAAAEFVIWCLLGFLWWFILFPVVWLVSTPFILILAVFSRKQYKHAVFDMFDSVHGFWIDWGLLIVP